MVTVNATSDTTGRARSVAMILVGIILILLALVWAAPIVAYQCFGDKIVYQDLSLKENMQALAQLPGSPLHMIIRTIVASPLPLLIFGLGLLWSARWAKWGAIVTLLAQLGAILAILHVAVRPFIIDVESGATIELLSRHDGYLAAGGALLLNGLLTLVLLLARRKARA